MLHKTHGIVLHTVKFTDSSIIAKIYTADFGLQSFIVKGVRSAGKSNKISLFSPLTVLEIEMFLRENKNLQYLKEYRPAYLYKTIPTDILKSSIALFLAEVLHKCIREEAEVNRELYSFIEQTLLSLDASPKAESNLHLLFLLDLARHLGFFPNSDSDGCDYFDLKDGSFTPDIPPHSYFIGKPHSENLKQLLTGEAHVAMSVTDRNFLLDKLLLYYQLHLQNFQKVTSHHVLHEVLAS